MMGMRQFFVLYSRACLYEIKVKRGFYVFIELCRVIWNRYRNAHYFIMKLIQVYIFLGMWNMYLRIHLARAIVTKHIINIGSFAHYTLDCFRLICHVNALDGGWFHVICQSKEVWSSEPGGAQRRMPIAQAVISQILFLPWGLELRSASWIFDLVSIISKILLGWISCRLVTRKSRGLDWGVILFVNIFYCRLIFLV